MKIVRFKGGLGNQLFQYAFLLNLEKYDSNLKVVGDFNYYNIIRDDIRVPRIKELGVKINEVSKHEIEKKLIVKRFGKPHKLMYKLNLAIEQVFNNKYFLERNLSHKSIDNLLKYDYFDGYWQSWKYVEKVDDVLRRIFFASDGISENASKFGEVVSSENAVFICIRRGDYVTDRRNLKLYGEFNSMYYNEAIKIISNVVNNPKFYIFTNDVNWVKNNMKFDVNVEYASDIGSFSDVEELILMSTCKHGIIANSTFHWWGAWMIENPNKTIVAPNNWFANNKKIDIIPNTWVKIENKINK